MEKLKPSKLAPVATFAKGFTLIEALVATGVLVIAIFSLISLLSLGLKVVKINKEKTQKILASQAIMEEYLSLSYKLIPGTEISPGLKKVIVNDLLTTYVTKR